MTLKRLTYDAFELFLKISNIQSSSDFPIKRVDKLYKLADKAYYRYKRRLNTWEHSDYYS